MSNYGHRVAPTSGSGKAQPMRRALLHQRAGISWEECRRSCGVQRDVQARAFGVVELFAFRYRLAAVLFSDVRHGALGLRPLVMRVLRAGS